MTPAEFKRKWARFTGKESAGYQEHFNDLCRLLEQPSPAEADPTGSESFCFQKRVVKDAEFFELHETGTEATGPTERGFADVWKKGCFAWEYKGKKKNLDDAYRQLLRYRESLLNPPLLVVCDFDRYIIRTNFNGTVQETHEFTNGQIDRPENLRLLRALFENPDFLKPQRTTAQITEHLAGQIAEVARSLQGRESVELADATTREEVQVAQKKNLRIARFLNRIIFCFFAEDTGLLPKKIFSELCKAGLDDPRHFAETLEKLFRVMATGGTFGSLKIRHFNGHLFEDSTVFELTEEEIRKLADASEADWQFIQPSIMGTLFERAMDESQRAQLGAHYTSEADIKTLVEPVLMAPFRREWAQIKRELATDYARGEGTADAREKLASIQKKLSITTVLDPACGSGNFLYVSLQLLLGLEKEVFTFGTQLGFRFEPQVNVQQLKAIEINPYAFELAQASVQIGYLQWRRDNGFDNDRSPVLQDLDGFENKDALLNQTFRKRPKSLKEARSEEHAEDNTVKVYTERAWPKCDVILGNPPFLGGKFLRRELDDEYVEALFENFGARVRPEADLCCYWFEKAREQIEARKCKRAGLLATQGIRGGANRETLKHIKQTGDIFFAESDREWVLAGANVHVSMIGFDDGKQRERVLDGKPVTVINADLSSIMDVTQAERLRANEGVVFMGDTKGGSFDLPEADALAMLDEPNPHGLPNSDVVLPWANGLDITRRSRGMWILNFGTELTEAGASAYASPFSFVREHVRETRLKNNRETYRKFWWRHVEARPGMLAALAELPRFLATVRVSKHRLFVWLVAPLLPDCQLFAFARADDYFFGVLHSRIHEIWARAHGTQVRERESGFRYTPTTCFETFPFPFPDDLQPPKPTPPPERPLPKPDPIKAEMDAAHHYLLAKETPRVDDTPRAPDEHRAAIAASAKELNELRERWLNPPEWTVEKVLEFPGSVGGPWDRYIAPSTINTQQSTGLVRYPRLEPRDAESAVRLKKRTLTNLYNERPTWLDLAHKKLDIAVARAYGWNDLAHILEHTSPGTVYDFQTGTYVDLDTDAKGLAEALRGFRRAFDEQILERLLQLNLARAAEEKQKVKPAKKPKSSREKREDEMI